ncbi:uncharacterized protein LOC122081436 isoform X2 [Macadamia integrifolia]|uniref:uncharacterized protein LOC122081436 isoform X2 n=1 Tax=Macadamia integrifolia TaxID=60698 RepID=UPI001C4F8041|nr:uncharacterized protein LOC122081436 isoform X2 [Macadamia integrifolia]
MDNQRISPLGWAYHCHFHGKTMEELRESLLCTTLELETTRAAAQEEIRKREEQLIRLHDLLRKAVRERDEAQDKCQRLHTEKLLLLQQQQQQQQGISSIEDEARRGGDISDCEESIVSSPVMDPMPPLEPPSAATVQLAPEKPLPEKGKLLQAVTKAGPLLQTLLLAGPLPQWRHPPPKLDSFEIPPVAITSPPPTPHLLHHNSVMGSNDDINNSGGSIITKRKRSLGGFGGFHSSPSTKE